MSRVANNPIRIIAFIRTMEQTGISAINYYRAYSPLATLGQCDERFTSLILDQRELKRIVEIGQANSLLGYDLYVVSRLFAGRDGRGEFMQAIRDSGGKIVFDTDDDLTDEHRDLGRGEDFLGILGVVDAVTVSTPHLADQLTRHTMCKPWALPNHVDVKWFASLSERTVRQEKGLTIGFIGTASHFDDWIYPVKALARLTREHSDMTIVAAGYVPEYLRELPNLVELKAVPYAHYPGLVRQFDIVCCSLDPDDEFNKSKSSIKALEAMSAARVLPNGKRGGAVPVCTKMKVYRRTVQHRHNGLLVDNDEWYDALSLLIKDARLRNKLAVLGLRWVRKQRDIATGYKLWSRAYREILGRDYDRN